MKHYRSLSLGAGFACLFTLALAVSSAAADENPVLQLSEMVEPGMNLSFVTRAELPLHVSRRAGRVLETLKAEQEVTVLAIDRFGLQVRGRGKHGPVTGWVGQRKAFAGEKERLEAIQAFYERQIEVERLVTAKGPAIGMSLHELRRIFGKPSTHHRNEKEGEVSHVVVWSIVEKMDLGENLGLGSSDSEILKMEVEIGRVEIEMVKGIAKSISMNIEDGAEQIPTIKPPVATPFGPDPGENALAGTAKKE